MSSSPPVVTGSGNSGQARYVQCAGLFCPLAGQTHVLRPSPAGYVVNGVQLLRRGGSQFGQAMRVQADSFLKPLSAHMQLLQPSAAAKVSPGQQTPSSLMGSGRGAGGGGTSGQAYVVHWASSLFPLAGQRQLLTPSPAGKESWGTHKSCGNKGGGQDKRVHAESFRRPLLAQRQVLQPSAATNVSPGQQWPSSGSELGGSSGQSKLVQLASALMPLQGQVQVFNPSPAGN